jgi:hypothetical protein
MAHHPQTDGQSERTNQWLEQYLRIYSNFQQNDWARWLPLAQFVHNSWPSSTTRKTPFELLIGFTPQAQEQQVMDSALLALDERSTYLCGLWEQAQKAIRQAQDMTRKYHE